MYYWGYDFIERLETKGLFKSHDLRSKPLSRHVVARIIRDVHVLIKREPQKLTQAEYELFHQLSGDFYDELQALVTCRSLRVHVEDITVRSHSRCADHKRPCQTHQAMHVHVSSPSSPLTSATR